MREQVFLYDTTLRDGTQGEGISLSVDDKIKIVKKLDEIGVHYIEGGWPGSNPKDMEFFQKVQDLQLSHSKITAFGSTRRIGVKAKEDENLQKLIESGVKVVAIFGKTWDFQVIEALKTTLEENLDMIRDSVAYLKENGLEVIFDAEHFFDGYKQNKEYALKAIKVAEEAGADCIALCDTNGGTLPHEIYKIVKTICTKINIQIGIHCHNDGEVAVANSLSAVQAGARHVQGTINGYGERCGNANLISVIPNLQVKLNYECVKKENLSNLTSISKYVHEVANQAAPSNQPFVGKSAFAHKGGMHVSAVLKHPETYEHIKPELIGNSRRVLVSELSGQSNLMFKAKEWNYSIDKKDPNSKLLLEKIKEKEHEGYQYEAAEASFELLVKKSFSEWKEYFLLDYYKIFVEKNGEDIFSTEAVVKLCVHDEMVLTAAEGNGPVNALDHALRKGLEQFYPIIKNMYLSDYKVRVLDETEATASKVRVLIESSDGTEKWSTIGVSGNIIKASWLALVDSVQYYLMKNDNLIKVVSNKKEEQFIGLNNH
ncbi:citramalate synthase [Anaerobacillus alkalidiazotrophicus]|uniref:Citramalate synthase n=1 Tax=Anaerobacillus alkalidiazotrophicus TaxID=472963 RepID=A0A1S2M6K8_9BACI|nr:citramalate synthase [Anaerobacillus alkalidiazotrophicus]OIJ20368.1 citramalate synthase [Anaerobacillus alkalidiazotrophicus]